MNWESFLIGFLVGILMRSSYYLYIKVEGIMDSLRL